MHKYRQDVRYNIIYIMLIMFISNIIYIINIMNIMINRRRDKISFAASVNNLFHNEHLFWNLWET